MAANDDDPCLTCRKKCATVPKRGCAWWEPQPDTRGWRDVFEQIDYSRYEGNPSENLYVYG